MKFPHRFAGVTLVNVRPIPFSRYIILRSSLLDLRELYGKYTGFRKASPLPRFLRPPIDYFVENLSSPKTRHKFSSRGLETVSTFLYANPPFYAAIPPRRNREEKIIINFEELRTSELFQINNDTIFLFF